VKAWKAAVLSIVIGVVWAYVIQPWLHIDPGATYTP
jgi:hypothetical protein